MLSDQTFYYKLFRKYVILFGNIFNNISVIRRNVDTDAEIEKFKVPINYAPKEKYVTRLETDPDLMKSTQITLPRISFQISGITYDKQRKQNSMLRTAAGSSTTRTSSQYMGVPYDIDFDLFVYARNIDDGNQIIEQILPYFTPDYTITIDPVPAVGFIKDIPVVLNSVSDNTTYEGNFDSIRYVYWTLKFTVKGYFYGPISTPKIIRKSIANIFNDPSLYLGNIVKMNLNTSANITFIEGDTIYQGSNYQTATAYGIVYSWRPTTKSLIVTGTQGNFTANSTIRSVTSNANCVISSFDTSPVKLVNIQVEPDPITAEPGDDFGYATTVTEFPDTLE